MELETQTLSLFDEPWFDAERLQADAVAAMMCR